jgi:hypothetical protein
MFTRLLVAALLALLALPAAAAADADGGDRFPVLREGTDRLGRAVDTDALEAYIAPSLSGAPIAPPGLQRIDVVP